MSELELVCSDFNAALEMLRAAGLRLECIYPADDPSGAVLEKDGTRVRLLSVAGTVEPSGELPPFQPEFVLTRAGGDAGVGRAGMRYRDLIPGRLGGRYIASHITIPEGGPVADWVHFHHIAVQALYIAAGWVCVVYEDQGEAFVLEAGDLVLQPPGIRHQVLESSGGLEVIEFAAPALHATFADHEMALPNGKLDPARDFSGQRFLRHIAADTPWTAFLDAEAQETRLHDATGGLANARTIRSGGAETINFGPHDGELVLGFVLSGSAQLTHNKDFPIAHGDAFVIPPTNCWKLGAMSEDFRLLHVTTAALGDIPLAVQTPL